MSNSFLLVLRRSCGFSLYVLLAAALCGGMTAIGAAQATQGSQDSQGADNSRNSDNSGNSQNSDGKQGSKSPDNSQDGKKPEDRKKPAKSGPKKEKPLAPANPLVLVNPQDGSGNMPEKYDRYGNSKRPISPRKEDMGDYQGSPSDPRVTLRKNKPLPLFGYNFFQDARQRIDIRRELLSGRLRVTPSGTARPSARSAAQQNQTGTDNSDQTGVNPRKPGVPANQNQPNNQQNAASPRNRASQDNRDGRDGMSDTDSPPDEADVPSRQNRNQSNRSQQRASDTAGQDDQDTGGSGQPRNSGSGLRDDSPVDAYGMRVSRRRLQSEAYAIDPDAPGNSSRRSRTYRPDTDITDDAADTEDDNLGGNGDDADNQDDYGRTQQIRRQSLSGRNPARGNSNSRMNQNDIDTTDRTDSTTYDSRNNVQDVMPSTPGGSVNAFYEVADPLTQLTRNVIASATSNYQLAGGDVVTIRISSPTMTARQFERTVDSMGNLDIPGVGRVVIRGMTLEHARGAILERLQRVYKKPQVSLNLQELRTISVIVSGEVYLPGTYNVPAVATAFNILYVAGGPTRDGSLRRAEVRRQGKLVGVLDFYKYLVTGDQGDISLQSGDLLYIPAYQSRVAMKGEVRQPAIYELVEGETLQDALKFAGGIKSSGVNQQVQISTLDPGNARVLKTADLKEPGAAQKLVLYDGDAVDVFSLRPMLANKVTVEGAVDQPNDYALVGGMRVSDLVAMARNPLTEAYLTRAELYRWNPDNTTTLVPVNLEKALSGDKNADLLLQRWDRLKVFSREEVAWTGYRKVEVRGAVQRPGIYQASTNMHVSDLLLRVGGPTPDAHLEWAALVHQHGDGSYRYDYINLAGAMKGDADNDKVVEDNDLLTVYKIGQAQFVPDRVVTIRGSVQAPGIYPRGEGMRISELLKLAGGFKPGAVTTISIAHARKAVDSVKSGVNIAKVSFDAQNRCAAGEDVVLEDDDMVTVQGTGGFVDRVQIVTVNGWVSRPGPIVLRSKTMRLSDAIHEAGGLRPEAFPEGAEFFREPSMLSSDTQRELALNISKLNDLLNANAYSRERAKSYLERIRVAGSPSDTSVQMLGSTPPANQPIPESVERQLYTRELVSRPRTLEQKQLTPTGNIAVNLVEALKRPNGTDDIILTDGDTITVPERPTTILVAGAVFNGRGVLYKEGAKLDYYIAQAGGFAPDAAKDNMLIVRAGGGTIPANKIRSLSPGDFIFVPTRVQAEKVPQNSNVLESIFRNVTNTALLFRVFGL